jgi:hypothetical protein
MKTAELQKQTGEDTQVAQILPTVTSVVPLYPLWFAVRHPAKEISRLRNV